MRPFDVLRLKELYEVIAHEVRGVQSDDPLHECGRSVIDILPIRPLAVRELAHKKLHAYPFQDVPNCWRRAFEDACLWQIEHLLQSFTRNGSTVQMNAGKYGLTTQVVHLCDSAIIISGAPQRRYLVDRVLSYVDQQVLPVDTDGDRPAKRRRIEGQPRYSAAAFVKTFDDAAVGPDPIIGSSHALESLYAPDLSHFSRHMHTVRRPVILRKTIDFWPAVERWQDPDYWLARTHGGRRLVPVELGRSYTDEGWGQRIMEFGEYLEKYVLEIQDNSEEYDQGASATRQPGPQPSAPPKGYLAQHDLLSQIPGLRNDIAIPDYCYVDPPRPERVSAKTPSTGTDQRGPPPTPPASPDEDTVSDDENCPSEPQLNIWLGPAGTISPAHTDPHENILAQVVGRKYVRLFAPSEGTKMYPMGSEEAASQEEDSRSQPVDMQNTSRVDVGAFMDCQGGHAARVSRKAEQDRLFPDHKEADFIEGVLEAGESLYIPRGWWHYVQSLSPSCSVSFWWD